MGWQGTREPPFYFTKFADTLRPSGTILPYPPETADFQHEGELVVQLSAAVFRAGPDEAAAAVGAYAAGLDMTRRDIQLAARKEGRPWDLAKNFDGAAVAGAFTLAAHAGDMQDVAIRLTVNGDVRQQGRTADMIFGVAEIIADLSRYGPLGPGDLIFTGTPEGVGAIARGQRVDASLEGLQPLSIRLV